MREILYLINTKENFDKYIPLIDSKVLSKEAEQIIKDLDNYYQSFEKTEVDWDEFTTWFCIVQHSSWKQEKLDLYRTIFTNVKEYTPTDTYEDIIQSLITKEYAAKIADKAMLIADGVEHDILPIQELMDEYQDKHVSAGETIELTEMPTFEDLHTTMSSSGDGLDWRLECLNKSLGPLRKGDFVVVGKRPEVGGTTFVASESTFMAAQLPDERPVLVIANEEAELAVMHRYKQAAIGKDINNITYDKALAESEYITAVGNSKKIQLKHKAGVTVQDIIDWCEAYNPGLIIIDQLWKVDWPKVGNKGDVQRLTALFQEARRWSQKYAPVIAVHQADAIADNEKWLHYDRLYMVKTAAQGEADAIIMIGATDEIGCEYTRYLNIPKNKLLGGPYTEESLRHGKFEVRIRADIGRFSDK